MKRFLIILFRLFIAILALPLCIIYGLGYGLYIIASLFLSIFDDETWYSFSDYRDEVELSCPDYVPGPDPNDDFE